MTEMTAPHSPAAAAPGAAPAGFVEKAPLERYLAPERPSLVGLSRAALAEALGTLGVPAAQRKMRVQQLWHWLYVRGAISFDDMTSMSKELRGLLERHFTLARPEVVAEQTSVDGTRKWLVRLPGEHGRPHEVECVYIPEADRDALLLAADGDGIAISKRRITLSTSGVVPNIARAGAEIGCMLAVSLHAVRDDLRDQLVPLNRKYPIAELLAACRGYPGLSNARRITFEYVMLKGVNDSLADAKALVRLLQGIPSKINFDAGYASPVRTPRGRDILAACGQLKSATEKLSARERLALRAMAMTD